jgi:Ribonuclease toxin, BrnT, of type II toxin-antitoxin system
VSEATFEWDSRKELENIAKHGVSYFKAQYAFSDRYRVFAKDLEHSSTEERYKVRQSMSAKIKYTAEPMGMTQVVPDFLPSPAELAYREEGVKVTLALSKKSIDYFKSEAGKHQTQYQRMIRRLLDAYVDAQVLTERTKLSAKAPRARM